MLIEDCFNVFTFDTDDVDVDFEASPNLSTGIKFSLYCEIYRFLDQSFFHVYQYSYENRIALLFDLELNRFYDNIYKTHMLGLSDLSVSNLYHQNFQAIHLKIQLYT